MNKLLMIMVNYFSNYYWTCGEILIVVVGIFLLKKYRISGKTTAVTGFVLLFITMLFSLMSLDDVAKKIAEFVWILFAISFVQEFYHFLKHENK